MSLLSSSHAGSALSGYSDPDSPSRNRRPVWQLNLLVGLWLAFPANIALWMQLSSLPDLQGLRGVAFAASLGLMVTCGLMTVFSLLSWRFILKPAIVLLLVAAAGGAYFMTAYRVVIDPTMMVNVMQTDWRETRDLLHPLFFVALVVLGLLPAWLAWRTPVVFHRFPAQALRNFGGVVLSLLLLAAVALAAFQDLSSVMRNHKSLRYTINPFNSIYSIGRAVQGVGAERNRPILPVGEDARLGASHRPGEKPPLLLLVVGETARAANFSLNGYVRNTNPALAAENVASFRQVFSCGTSTAASLPCMFSHLGRKDFESRDSEFQNLLDVLQRAGLAVLWIDNQSGCKGLCDRVPQVTPQELRLSARCDGDECPDDVMVDEVGRRIAALPAAQRAHGVVVVMHQMGSHGPAYYKRSPLDAKPFLPECQSSALQQCERQSVVNAYDNTIATTDRFLAKAIRWLRSREADFAGSLLYVSDHGESLGENNLYLHGLPYAIAPDEQKHVPLIVWMSPAAQASSGVTMTCLKGRLDEPLSHDNLFHSVLGLMDVTTALYQRPLDFFSACVGADKATAVR